MAQPFWRTTVTQLNPFETELPTVEYTTMLELLLQQKVSKLRSRVNTATVSGAKQMSPVQQIAAVEFRAPAGRYAPIQFQIPNYTRRWVYPVDKDVAIPVDTFDQLKTIVDPKGGISEAVVAAANRYFDDAIIAAAFASATTGTDPGTTNTESWPASTYVVADTFDSASTVGMTYAKIVEGRRILEHYQNDLDAEMVTLVEGSQQNSDLMKQMEVIDKLYNDKPVVENGRVKEILGTQIVTSERLSTVTVSSNACRQCIMFVKSGLHFAVWKDMDIRVEQRHDLTSFPWQLYAMVSVGATRLQLGKVIEVRAYDTTSVDPTAP